MRYRPFGTTGWQVSALSVGTVELGVEYGLYADGEARLPPVLEAGVEVLLRAFEAGVNLVDTAPGYGAAEAVVGEALRRHEGRIYVATKVTVPTGGDRGAFMRASVEASVERLGGAPLDLVQIHNATAADLRPGGALDELELLRREGLVAHLGASVYGAEDALEALQRPEVVVLQLALSLLDQRMTEQIVPLAEERGVAVLVRSALLKGVLTPRHEQLPPHLAALAAAARRAHEWASNLGAPLAEAALRYCMATAAGGSVLVGVRDRAELESALVAAEAPPIDGAALAAAKELAVADPDLVDPRTWGIP